MFPHVFTLVLYLSIWLQDSPENQVGIGFNGKALSQPIYNTIKMYNLLSHTPPKNTACHLPLFFGKMVDCHFLCFVCPQFDIMSIGPLKALSVHYLGPGAVAFQLPNTCITVSIARKDLKFVDNLFVSCFPVQRKSPLSVVIVAFASPNDSINLLFFDEYVLGKTPKIFPKGLDIGSMLINLGISVQTRPELVVSCHSCLKVTPFSSNTSVPSSFKKQWKVPRYTKA